MALSPTLVLVLASSGTRHIPVDSGLATGKHRRRNAYYAVANTFWNGDVPGQRPYTHNTDFQIRIC